MSTVGVADRDPADVTMRPTSVPQAAGSPVAAAVGMGRPGLDGRGALIVVPTYNERDNLPDLLVRLHQVVPASLVLVVDDDSPDGTGTVADELAAVDSRVLVLHRRQRAGLGAAYTTGFATALRSRSAGQVGWIVQMDADGSHRPEDLPRLLRAAGEADVVLGSRYIPGAQTRGWPARRRWLSRLGNVYARRALHSQLRDMTGGFRVFHRGVVEQLPLEQVASRGYCFQIELAFRVLRAGYRVREVPITFIDRSRGTSKMSGRIVREALWQTTRWGVRARAHCCLSWLRGFGAQPARTATRTGTRS